MTTGRSSPAGASTRPTVDAVAWTLLQAAVERLARGGAHGAGMEASSCTALAPAPVLGFLAVHAALRRDCADLVAAWHQGNVVEPGLAVALDQGGRP